MQNNKRYSYFESGDYSSPPSHTPPPSPPRPPSHGLAIASIVLGGGALVLIWVKFIAIFFALIFILTSIIGIMIAVSARKKGYINGHPTGLATIGLLLNILSLIIYSLGFTACSVCVACTFTLF